MSRRAAPPPVEALLVDLDGTVWEAGEAIPGAPEAIAALRGAGLPLLFATNTTRRPCSELAARLAAAGIPARPADVLNAPRAAAGWLAEQGARRIAPYLAEASWIDLGAVEVDFDAPDYVVVGDLGAAWDFPTLNRAFRALLGGAGLVAVQRNRYWRNDEGELALDAGPFVVALEYASGTAATLVGKPSPDFFRLAVDRIGRPAGRVAMVGDDLEADVHGARRAGLLAIAVRTGKLRPEDEPEATAAATAVLDSLADLPAWLTAREGSRSRST